MIRLHPLLALIFLLAGSPALADESHKEARRVVSLDYCADQYVLKLLPRERILALSIEAQREFSYMHEEAVGLKQVRPVAEDVLVLQPDLIVRTYGGGPQVSQFLERAGVPVVQVPYANDIEAIRQSIMSVANALGEPENGAAVVKQMDDRLRAIEVSSAPKNALYMTPGGVTSGPGTLIHEMLVAAGLENFEQKPGWRSIPLEELVYSQPDVIAAAFFDEGTFLPSQWGAMQHPVARRQMQQQPTVQLNGSWTSCGAWFLLDAIEALAAGQVSTVSR